jgi:hypothetical protein
MAHVRAAASSEGKSSARIDTKDTQHPVFGGDILFFNF